MAGMLQGGKNPLGDCQGSFLLSAADKFHGWGIINLTELEKLHHSGRNHFWDDVSYFSVKANNGNNVKQ